MLFKKKKRKDRRRVYGFLCLPELRLIVKLQSKELQVPISYYMEHLIQLGLGQTTPDLEDEAAKEKLRKHLEQKHLIEPSLDPDDEYERAVLEVASIKNQERQETDKIAEQLIKIAKQANIPPGLVLAGAIRYIRISLDKKRQEKEEAYKQINTKIANWIQQIDDKGKKGSSPNQEQT